MRVALGIEYDGTAYVGWQRQKSGVGVQAILEATLSQVADEPVAVVCAGRTDTGVHATGQVIHFDTDAVRTDRGWLLGANSNLPDDINVSWATQVADDFHARFSATRRSYRYLILNRPYRSALHRNRAWWVYESLDEVVMQEAANYLLGKHDFSAFRAAGCQASTPVRELSELSIERRGNWLLVTVRANAFLQHMVRNITGTLVAVGRGEQKPAWAQSVLQSCDRSKGGIAAPPNGLTLIGVDYPDNFGLPQNSCTDEIRL
jgi:tRNA pseudouridine38-40 synthase